MRAARIALKAFSRLSFESWLFCGIVTSAMRVKFYFAFGGILGYAMFGNLSGCGISRSLRVFWC